MFVRNAHVLVTKVYQDALPPSQLPLVSVVELLAMPLAVFTNDFVLTNLWLDSLDGRNLVICQTKCSDFAVPLLGVMYEVGVSVRFRFGEATLGIHLLKNQEVLFGHFERKLRQSQMTLADFKKGFSKIMDVYEFGPYNVDCPTGSVMAAMPIQNRGACVVSGPELAGSVNVEPFKPARLFCVAPDPKPFVAQESVAVVDHVVNSSGVVVIDDVEVVAEQRGFCYLKLVLPNKRLHVARPEGLSAFPSLRELLNFPARFFLSWEELKGWNFVPMGRGLHVVPEVEGIGVPVTDLFVLLSARVEFGRLSEEFTLAAEADRNFKLVELSDCDLFDVDSMVGADLSSPVSFSPGLSYLHLIRPRHQIAARLKLGEYPHVCNLLSAPGDWFLPFPEMADYKMYWCLRAEVEVDSPRAMVVSAFHVLLRAYLEVNGAYEGYPSLGAALREFERGEHAAAVSSMEPLAVYS